MKENTKRFMRVSVIFCVIMILVYAFAAVLPHTHSVFNSECVLCAVIESARVMSCGALLCAFICRMPEISSTCFVAYCVLHTEKLETPVGLKVKLSD